MLFLLFASCALKPDLPLISLSRISYPDLIDNYNSCEERIYSFKRRNAWQIILFIQVSEIALLLTFLIFGKENNTYVFTPEKITVRDLINNTYYSQNQVVNYFPFLKVLDNQNISEVVWCKRFTKEK